MSDPEASPKPSEEPSHGDDKPDEQESPGTTPQKRKRAPALKRPASGPMKRPASKAAKLDDEHEGEPKTLVLKRPASKVESLDDMLTHIQEKEDAEIDTFWQKLSNRQQQTLWKRFEHKRKADGTESQYKESCSGRGRNQKTLTLMKLYLKFGSTKHPAFVNHLVELKQREVFDNKERWQPKAKFGKAELKSRVEAGTIKCRKSPSDSRFPEFLEVIEETSRSTEKVKAKAMQISGKASWNDFKMLADMEMNEQTKLEFLKEDDQESNSSGSEGSQEFAKSFFVPKKNKKGNALTDFETASALAEVDEIPAAKLKACKKKLMANLKKFQHKVKGEALLKDIQACLKNLESLERDTPTGVARKVRAKAASTGKMAMKSLS